MDVQVYAEDRVGTDGYSHSDLKLFSSNPGDNHEDPSVWTKASINLAIRISILKAPKKKMLCPQFNKHFYEQKTNKKHDFGNCFGSMDYVANHHFYLAGNNQLELLGTSAN